MKIIRDDEECLVCQYSMSRLARFAAPLIFGGQVALVGYIAWRLHATELAVGSLVAVAGLVIFFSLASRETTFIFARESRRLLVIRKYLRGEKRQEFDFDQVQAVILRRLSRSSQALYLLMDNRKKIAMSVYTVWNGALRKYEDAALVRRALGMPEDDPSGGGILQRLMGRLA